MNNFTAAEVVIGILYASGALLLLITAYILYIRKIKKSRLQEVSEVLFETSHNNVFKEKTQFQLTLSSKENIKLELKTKDEQLVKNLIDTEMEAGQHLIDFDPREYEQGKYYLYLKTQNGSIFRKIEIIR